MKTEGKHRDEELWQKLEAELWKHGLEVTFRGGVFDTRDFMARVHYIGEKQEARLQLSFLCLDNWRQNEIDAAIAAVKKELKPRLPKNPPAQARKVARKS